MMHHKLMITLFCSLMGLLGGKPAWSQNGGQPTGIRDDIAGKLQASMDKLSADSSMKHAMISLYVEDAATGEPVFAMNPQIGLAPASCQKLFTSVAALDLLGPDYRYSTLLGYKGKIDKGFLKGDLYIVGNGDPTLGSWRFGPAKEDAVLSRWVAAVKAAGIKKFEGDIVADDSRWGTQPLPGGWIWEDIGNYYGAGSWGLNWHENQYDLRLKPGLAVGDSVKIIKPAEHLEIYNFVNELKTGAPGSGDNTFIYLPPYHQLAFVRGTVPLQKEDFVISGSIPVPPRYTGILLGERLQKEGLSPRAGDVKFSLEFSLDHKAAGRPDTIIDRYLSPRLDSINYWFLKKSINLYGEALIRTLASEKARSGGADGPGTFAGLGNRLLGPGEEAVASTEKGAEIVRDFWGERGIDRSAIHIMDGSGLSPQNRVTTAALVRVLQYARKRSWYPVFYQALPVINEMRMKSGAIGGARSYSGYQRSADGREYVFSMIVNNYDGPAPVMVKKMFAVLDLLK